MNEKCTHGARRQSGSILIMVLFLSILLAGSAAYLLARTRSEIVTQHSRKYTRAAMQYAIGGMTIAQVRVNAGPWDAGPTGNLNAVLYGRDPTDDGVPGGFIINDGTYSVQVDNKGNMWYELTSRGTAGDALIGGISRVIKLRVRDRDFFSRFSLFLENGDAIVDDTNNWYGAVHVNERLRFRNRDPNVGAHFYNDVTSCNQPVDYAESGGAAQAWYAETPVFNAEPIEMPAIQEFNDLKNQAESGDGQWYDWGEEDDAVRVWVGDNGISILPLANYGRIELVFEMDGPKHNRRQELDIHIWDDDGEHEKRTILSVPQNAVIYSQEEISGVEGEIYGRMTVASATGRILISDDIEYCDYKRRHPYDYDHHHQEDPNNFTSNHHYRGDACLAMMAKKDIILSGHNDHNDSLVIHGVMAAGVGDPQEDGAVRWWDWGEEDYNDTKKDLRVFGALLADGKPIAGMIVGHFKGWTSGGSHAGGYTNSIFRYDHSLRANPPPHFMEITLPMYAGWQLIRGAR